MDARLRLGIVSDAHVAPADTPPTSWHGPFDFAGAVERLEHAASRFAEEAVDGVIMLGDLTHAGDAPSLERGLAALAEAGRPIWLAPGNHDVACEGDAGPMRARGRDATGAGTALVDGLRLAVLEIESRRCGTCFGLRTPPATAAWGDDPTLLASHFPALSCASGLAARGLRYAGDLIDASEFADALLGRPAPTVVLSGHLHVRDAYARGRVLQLLFPPVIESPFECAIVEVNARDDHLRIRRQALPLYPARVRRASLLDLPIEEWAFVGARWSPSPASRPIAPGR
jgi:3',5'-cyclic AMP phosphodiesterase CpdA